MTQFFEKMARTEPIKALCHSNIGLEYENLSLVVLKEELTPYLALARELRRVQLPKAVPCRHIEG